LAQALQYWEIFLQTGNLASELPSMVDLKLNCVMATGSPSSAKRYFFSGSSTIVASPRQPLELFDASGRPNVGRYEMVIPTTEDPLLTPSGVSTSTVNFWFHENCGKLNKYATPATTITTSSIKNFFPVHLPSRASGCYINGEQYFVNLVDFEICDGGEHIWWPYQRSA